MVYEIPRSPEDIRGDEVATLLTRLALGGSQTWIQVPPRMVTWKEQCSVPAGKEHIMYDWELVAMDSTGANHVICTWRDNAIFAYHIITTEQIHTMYEREHFMKVVHHCVQGHMQLQQNALRKKFYKNMTAMFAAGVLGGVGISALYDKVVHEPVRKAEEEKIRKHMEEIEAASRIEGRMEAFREIQENQFHEPMPQDAQEPRRKYPGIPPASNPFAP